MNMCLFFAFDAVIDILSMDSRPGNLICIYHHILPHSVKMTRYLIIISPM